MIGRVAAPNAPKKTTAPLAVDTEHRIGDIEAELQPVSVVAIFTEDAATAELHPLARKAIDTVETVKDEIAEVDIFIVDEGTAHVAILVPGTVDGVVRVLALGIEDAKTRYHLLELTELLSECASNIKHTPVLKSTPLIRPEALMTEDGEPLIRRVDGDHLLLAGRARIFVVVAVIAKRDAPLLPTCGTVRRERKRDGGCADHRRELPQHRNLLIGDEELFCASCTQFLHKKQW